VHSSAELRRYGRSIAHELDCILHDGHPSHHISAKRRTSLSVVELVLFSGFNSGYTLVLPHMLSPDYVLCRLSVTWGIPAQFPRFSYRAMESSTVLHLGSLSAPTTMLHYNAGRHPDLWAFLGPKENV